MAYLDRNAWDSSEDDHTSFVCLAASQYNNAPVMSVIRVSRSGPTFGITYLCESQSRRPTPARPKLGTCVRALYEVDSAA